MSIGIFDVHTSDYLASTYSSLLENGSDDIFFTPVENVREERQIREDKGVDVGYPFISFWRGPFSWDSEGFNRKLSTLGINFCFPSNVPEDTLRGSHFHFVPVTVTYDVNYLDNKNFRRAGVFNLKWMNNVEKNTTREYSLPVEDRDDDFKMNFQMRQAEDLTDNSDLERRNESGVEFRYTGEIEIKGLAVLAEFEDGEVSVEDRELIQKVMLDLFLENTEETSDDDILVRQIVEK